MSTSSSSKSTAEELVEVVDGEPRGDPLGAVGELLDAGLLGVVLVGDLADDLLEDVLDGDDAGGAAVLVDDDGDVPALRLHLAQQVVDRLGVGHVKTGRITDSTCSVVSASWRSKTRLLTSLR